jgi:hypothetical protein
MLGFSEGTGKDERQFEEDSWTFCGQKFGCWGPSKPPMVEASSKATMI